ncbi:MAG: glycyl-radical enzyme activating protein [Ruminococcaceae bacterium]|nr:glycyl-radical enzyme activating protein [Oscillospiraceae bacterium]
MKAITATVFDIARNSYVDGPGIRTTVFFKGCNLRCAWCHNPESQNKAKEMLFYKNKCTGCGKCADVCPNHQTTCDLCGQCAVYCPTDAREICGKDYSSDGILNEILKDKAFYEASGGGVTFSGGECMLQIDFLEEILKACKENGIHTAVDTAGHVPFESFERILPYTDLFLYDVKSFDSEKHKIHTGVDNRIILENLKALLDSGKRLWVRIPIIPTINDSAVEMENIKRFLLSAANAPEKVELLPYHALGEHKYNAIGKTPRSFTTPSEEKMAELRRIFS